jgi:hypothetical protein
MTDVRKVILAIVLVFTIALAGLTIEVAINEGPDILTALSLLVLALFAFGIVGALRHPPEE